MEPVSILCILVIQLLYGALMAGHKAATAAPTWPTINGDWVPDRLMADQPWALNFIDNKILIHFIHRGLAYVLFVLIVIWSLNFSVPKVRCFLKKQNGCL
jgi:cytochrome c oxidase assembly protein subunit 15